VNTAYKLMFPLLFIAYLVMFSILLLITVDDVEFSHYYAFRYSGLKKYADKLEVST